MNTHKLKVTLSILMAIVVLAGATAVWVNSHEAITTLTIDSESAIVFSDNFVTTNAETTNNSYEKMEWIEVTNTDGALNLSVEINSTIQDNETDSCNNTGDVTIETLWNEQPVSDGEIVTAGNGLNYFNITTIAKKRACPQNVTSEVILTTI